MVVVEGVFESVDDLCALIDREAFVGQCRAGDVATQAFEGAAPVGTAPGANPRLHHSGGAMQGESRELGDARDMCRRAGRDGMQGEGLAPGMGADGDAVVDGGAEESLEAVGGLEVEGGGLVVTEQQSLFLEGAGDAHGDGVEQALEFGLCRGAATVQAGPFIVERVDAVEEEHVQPAPLSNTGGPRFPAGPFGCWTRRTRSHSRASHRRHGAGRFANPLQRHRAQAQDHGDRAGLHPRPPRHEQPRRDRADHHRGGLLRDALSRPSMSMRGVVIAFSEAVPW